MQPNPTGPIRAEPAEPPQPGRVVSNIREAALRTGVSFDYLLAQATQESGLDPHARNARSSASGLFQFTAPTWLDMVRRHGARHGLEAEAAAIVKGAGGRLEVADPAARKAILDLRKDPQLSALMAAEYARDNAKVLERRLGRVATASDLYLAHFLGAGGAARVIEGMTDNPRDSAQGLLPQAARANPEVFRRAGTVAGLYQTVQARFKTAMADGADPAQPALAGRVDLAQLRPVPRPEAMPRPVPPETSPTAQAVAQVASAAAPPVAMPLSAPAPVAAPLAETVYFPAPIPPAPTHVVSGPPGDTATLRMMIQAMDSAKDV